MAESCNRTDAVYPVNLTGDPIDPSDIICDNGGDYEIPDPSTVHFVRNTIITYARFFTAGCKFKTLDRASHRVCGIGNNGDPDSIYITINNKRVKLTNIGSI